MEEQVSRLVDKVWKKYQEFPEDKRLLIAIAGIPGSGKTTLSLRLVDRLNTLATSTTSDANDNKVAQFVPMDGYHYPRTHLSAMPDPILAHARRGAEFTFDGQAFLSLVQEIRNTPPSTTTSTTTTSTTTTTTTAASPSTTANPPTAVAAPSRTIYAPSFSHATKDPIPSSIPIHPWHKILIFEGNYLALSRAPWSLAAALMDEIWFVDVVPAVATARLVKRHVAAGICGSEEEAESRVRENDMVNGEEIVGNLVPGVQERVVSLEDGGWGD